MRRLRCRHVGRRRRPRPVDVPPRLAAAPALDLEHRQRAAVPAAPTALQQEDLPHRQTVSLRHPEGADKGGEVEIQEVALHFQAAERIGAIEDPHLAAGHKRRLGRPHRGGRERVVARAHVLEVDHHQVAAFEGARMGSEAAGLTAVQRDHRTAGPRIRFVRGRDHVLFDTVEAVLGSQERDRRLHRVQRDMSVDAAQAERGLVAQQRIAPTPDASGVLEQAVESGRDRHDRRKARSPSRGGSRRAGPRSSLRAGGP